jgi:hypothetical protein
VTAGGGGPLYPSSLLQPDKANSIAMPSMAVRQTELSLMLQSFIMALSWIDIWFFRRGSNRPLFTEGSMDSRR